MKSQSAPLFHRPVKVPSLTQSQVTAGNYGLKHKISVTCESTLITWLQVILLSRSNAFRYVCQVPTTVCRTLKTPPASISTRLQDSVQNKAYNWLDYERMSCSVYCRFNPGIRTIRKPPTDVTFLSLNLSILFTWRVEILRFLALGGGGCRYSQAYKEGILSKGFSSYSLSMDQLETH